MTEALIVTAVSFVATLVGIAAAWAGYKKGIRAEGANDGALKADTQYIKRRLDDILLDLRNNNSTLDNHNERITRVEESNKQAHKRIDGIERRHKEN